ncbi:MAG: O-antigen ligase family protein, partial [Ascidiaceihabitans sp.]|nr:O-antigen ligase family protein [Ascidiaceihabitans sp.]
VGLLGLVLVFCLKHGVSFSKLTPWIALIAIIYAILALYQLNWSPSGRVSFGYNPIPLGMIAVQLMFWCGCATLERQRSSLLALVGIVAAFWVVYLTASRAPGIVGFALLSVWFLFSKQPLVVRAAVLISCASILPLLNFLGELAKSSEVSSLNILFEPSNGSLLGRLSIVDSSIMTGVDTGVIGSGTSRSWIWHTGIDVIKQQPWLGWGREARLTQEMFRAVDAPIGLTTFPHFHNEIINMAVRFGIPAAILMVVSYASFF